MAHQRTRTRKKLWGEITCEDWCALLDQKLSTADSDSVAGGTVWMVKEGSGTTIGGMLYELAEKAGYEDPWGETNYDEAMDFVREHFMNDKQTTVLCEITSHMASGAWGLGQFISGDRGYFYRIADYGVGDDEGEAIPILSAWAPAHDVQAYEAAFLKTYTEHWGFGLPPDLGEWAEGPPKLMTKAIATVLAQAPGMWTNVLGKLKEPESALSHPGILRCIAKETGVSEASVLAAHTRFVSDGKRLAVSLANGEADDAIRHGLVALFWYALLLPEKRQLWEVYPQTILEIGANPQVVIDLRQPITAEAHEALKRLGLVDTFAVLTAYNPPGWPSGEEDNQRRTRALEADVESLGRTYRIAIGMSPDGRHREPGYAAAISREQATLLAKKYRQAAFFWFDGRQFLIVSILLQADPVSLPCDF